MKKNVKRLRTLLKRNLFLDQNTKRQLLDADEEKVAEIMPKLEEIDREQVRVFRGAIERNPNFFDDLGRAIQRDQAA